MHSKTKYTALFLSAILATSSFAADEKATLKANRTVLYNQTPSQVDSLAKLFTEGMFYGRIRSNNFYFDWKEEVDGLRKDNYATGLGGSIVYKTASWKGLSANAAFYGSESPIHMDDEDVKFIKSGKDTISRYDVANSKTWRLYSLAVANIDYEYSKTNLRLGRMMFESFLTKSNDTKMVPNTFEGVALTSKDIAKTTLKLGYFTRQKLRDHNSFHDVITFQNSQGESWGNNDDSANHRGLSYSNLQQAGKKTKNALFVAQIDNKSVKNLKIMLNYTAVPSLISSATVEAKYKVMFGSWSIAPAVRYMQQFDNGAGSIAGANLLKNTDGYKDPNSLKTYLVAAKLDCTFGKATKLRIGYSSVADKADIVAPWRGFPTGGYTRAMGQYNWQANTTTYMVRADYNFAKAGLVDGLKGMIRYAVSDFDEKKRTIMTDSSVVHIDFIYAASTLKGFETRLRYGYVDADNYQNADTSPSYSEYRLEFNYLF